MMKLPRILCFLVLALSFALSSVALKGDETVAFLGDSMTWIGGDNCEKETGWTYHFRQKFPDVRVGMFARSGATWTNTAATRGDINFYSAILDDENVIYDQVLRLIDTAEADSTYRPDVVLIFAGGNDAWFENKRPGIYDVTDFPQIDVDSIAPSQITSLTRSIELACRLTAKHFPEARIVLMTPPEMSKTSAERIHHVSDTIEAAGRSLGVKVLRADRELPFSHDVEASAETRIYTYDGAHSNPVGAAVIADYVSERL